MKKISSKISLGYLIIVSVLTTVIIFISYTTIKKYYINKLENDLSTFTNLIQSDIKLSAMSSNFNYDKIISKYNKNTQLRITIIDTSGVVLYDNKSDYRTMDNHRQRPEILDLESAKTSISNRFSNTLNSEMLYFAKRLK